MMPLWSQSATLCHNWQNAGSTFRFQQTVIDPMLGQRRRRCMSIGSALGGRILLAGL